MESLEALLELLTPLARLGRPALAAIDGRCGSGKSTLAGLCLLYTSPSPRDVEESRMPSSA